MSEQMPAIARSDSWLTGLFLVFAVLVGVVVALWSFGIAFFAENTSELFLRNVLPFAVAVCTTYSLVRFRPSGTMRWCICTAAPIVCFGGMLAAGRAWEGKWIGFWTWILLATTYAFACYASAVVWQGANEPSRPTETASAAYNPNTGT